MKRFDGKAIYNPSGKAGEYSYWACNFFVGCSNGCTYCYCKKGIFAGAMGQDKPQLKKCFKDEEHALELFQKELMQNLSELQKHGIFFTFTSDPCLAETQNLTREATLCAMENDVPVKILTKNADCWVDNIIDHMHDSRKKYLAIGFTLTGHDELELGASTNSERIEAMRKLHEAGFKTWASIEPIVDLDASFSMICRSMEHCDLYKVGLMRGKKYDWRELRGLMLACYPLANKFYFKDYFLNQADISRENLPDNCVNRDYNIFKPITK